MVSSLVRTDEPPLAWCRWAVSEVTAASTHRQSLSGLWGQEALGETGEEGGA